MMQKDIEYIIVILCLIVIGGNFPAKITASEEGNHDASLCIGSGHRVVGRNNSVGFLDKGDLAMFKTFLLSQTIELTTKMTSKVFKLVKTTHFFKDFGKIRQDKRSSKDTSTSTCTFFCMSGVRSRVSTKEETRMT